jgi:type VI secretion system protein ImpA
MPSPPTLDLEALLVPIADDAPAGASLRYAGTYDALQEARRSDDDLAQGEWVRSTKTADWHTVVQLATEALATRSKDLQIAVWLVEALIKRHGFAGLRDGLSLLWALQERFWDGLYPASEDGDLEFRAAPLEWLNEKLPPSLKQIPVTQGTNGEQYSWLRWDESRQVDNLGRRDQTAMQAALADGKITGEQFDKAADTTPLAYYQTLFADLQQSQEAYDKLAQLVDDKFGRDAPSLLDLKKVLDDCRALVEHILRKRGGLAPAPPPSPLAAAEASPEASLHGPSPITGDLSPSGPVPQAPPASVPLTPQDRADALRRLQAVAAYFRRCEPHSPVSYLVQRAIDWAELPLEEWLRHVIHDATMLESVRETLGLKDAERRSTQENQG